MPSVFLEAGGRADEETMKKAFELMGEQEPNKYSCHENATCGVLLRVYEMTKYEVVSCLVISVSVERRYA